MPRLKIEGEMGRFPPRNILLPVDFSDSALAGVAAAKMLWSRWGSRLDINYVCESIPAYLNQNENKPEERRKIEEFYRGIESRLHALVKNFQPNTVRLLDGYAKDVIPDLAASGEADWVIMGTHGYGIVKRMVLGSVSDEVIHASHVPVLTVRKAPPPDWPRRILAPVKFTENSDRAFIYAHRLAENLKSGISAMHAAVVGEPVREIFGALKEHLRKLAPDEPDVAVIEMVGDPAESILTSAKSGKFDLIVLSVPRKHFLDSLIVGRTAERVIRHSDIPVLSIPSVETPKSVQRSSMLEKRMFEALTKHR